MKKSSVLEYISSLDVHNIIINNILNGNSPHLKGLAGSLKAAVAGLWMGVTQRPFLFILPDREQAESLSDEINAVFSFSVRYFPETETAESVQAILNSHSLGKQMGVLRDIIDRQLRAVITTPLGFAQLLPSPASVKQARLHFMPGETFNLDDLQKRLYTIGYTREHLVERPGEISIRGGILDIFPFTGESPHRIEFFGESIDSIRTFDVETQRSIESVKSFCIMPNPHTMKHRNTLLPAFFDMSPVCFLEDPEIVFAAMDKAKEHRKEPMMDSGAVASALKSDQLIIHHTLSSPADAVDYGGRGAPHFSRNTREIRNGLIRLAGQGKHIIITCADQTQRSRVEDFLHTSENPLSDVVWECIPFRQGFDIPAHNLTVITGREILGKIIWKRRPREFREGIPLRELAALKKGDFVVHIDHGIGIYRGLEKITVGGSDRECLSLVYQDGDKLFVPVDKMERVQKYAGRDSTAPVLNKLGSPQWERTKSRTRKSLENIARDLISLYSVRSALPGHGFSEDTTWQKELEASFPFEETADQTQAIVDVKKDMEKSRPMDRLICGDVGYGKTEIAIRAAFKAVNDGKQVAVLVPTTILAQQHYLTFRERLEQFPVHIEMLSRFRRPAEQARIVEKMKNGNTDIVIGTHRLLSKDVAFKDLGLLVVDEEHRFGVKHKERLKAFRKTVDVLALSATPIPRTLQFSMMQIRDMSLMTTPPRDRLPIITVVSPFDENLIVEAAERELARGGQIFFVHNRVRSIHAAARMLERLVPGMTVGVAHGQMAEKDLENVMMDFLQGRFQCLVATMIIESGLDMPHVNTLIIHRADQLGLAQLYQLRGRVGRSNRRAYAYLLTPPFQSLTPDALKRLRTIEEFTELGSGFQIALRDLEIRGAGNLLGTRQSGNIDAVGYELYMKLVQEAVESMKSEAGEETECTVFQSECQVDADMPVYLPETYIQEESLRVNLYKRLMALEKPGDIDIFAGELKDRFGPLPQQAVNLLDVVTLRMLGRSLGLKQIVIEHQNLTVWFDDMWAERFESPELLSGHLRLIIDCSGMPVRLIPGKRLGMHLSLQDCNQMDYVKKWLQCWP